MINYYDSLAVEPPASEEEIKSAYRQLAKRFHPDVAGGDPVRFARIGEAYAVLSDPARRKVFDRVFRAAGERMAQAESAREFHPTHPAPDRGPGPPYTRVMSTTLAPGGRFLMEGFNGKISIQPTTAKGLWDTTTRKFGEADREGLARKVIQIRVNGPREVVRRMRPETVEFGVQFQGSGQEMFATAGMREGSAEGGSAGMFSPGRPFNLEQLVNAKVTVDATVPQGVPIYLYDLTGKVSVGDMGGELVATLDGNSTLRAGRITSANITLNGRSRAHIADLQGGMDALVFAEGKLLVGGEISRLRVVLEHQGHVEVVGNVGTLQATVGGRGYLNAKGTVDVAHCDARAGGYAKLAKVRQAISGSQSGAGQVDVIEGPPRGGAPQFGFR